MNSHRDAEDTEAQAPAVTERDPLKQIAKWSGLIVLFAGLAAGIAKAYFVTPLVLDRHGEQIKQLQDVDSETAKELRNMRDLLLEVRGDVKALSRNQNRKDNP